MQGGFDRLLSLPRTAFLSSNSNATAPIKEGETPLPPAHGLLAALLRQPSRTLTLPQAAAALGLPPPSSDHDDDDGSNLAHRLLTEQGPALTLLPPIHIGGNPRVGFASPLAERFGHAYLHHIGTGTGGSGGETDNKKNHVSAGPPVARALVAALMGLDPFKKEEKGGGGAGRFVSTTALVAAGAAGLYLTAAMGGAGGSVSSVFLHLPLQGAWWSDNVDKWARAAHGAAQASAAVAKDAACAVAGRLAAGAAALGERLAAAMAAAAKAGTGRRPGEE